MRYRNSGERRYGDGAGNSRHNFKRNSRLGQRARLFAAASKDKRVAALQPAHVLAFARLLDHEPVDVFLLGAFFARFLSNADDLGFRAGFFEQMQVDQAVMKDDVGFAEARQAPHGDQVGVSRAGANDVNGSGVLHDSIISLRRRSAPSWSFRRRHAMISEFKIRYCRALRCASSDMRRWISGLTSANSSASCAYSGPMRVAILSRNCAARPGLVPPVETATATSPRRTTAGMMKSHNAGLSAVLTSTPASVPSPKTARLTAASSVAENTSVAPAQSPAA